MISAHLLAFCEPKDPDGSRTYLQAPLREGAHVFATDGHAMIRIAVDGTDYATTDKVRCAAISEQAGIDNPDGWAPMPTFALPPHGLPSCRACRGVETIGLTRDAFANALSTWVHMQQRRVSVAEAMTTFNATQADVRRAIDDAYWLFMGCDAGETDPAKMWIEEDGE